MAPHLGSKCNGTSRFKEDDTMPIAIIGIGFRGPADATNVENFYKMLSEAREAWSPVPKTKWNHDAFYHPDPNRNGTVSLYWSPLCVLTFDSIVKVVQRPRWAFFYAGLVSFRCALFQYDEPGSSCMDS